jgi:hypothetical protein
VEQIAYSLQDKTFNPLPEVIGAYYRAERIRAIAPADANYAFLENYYVDTMEGKRVPVLFFSDGKSKAYVYILSTKDFNVAAAAPVTVGSGWRADVRRDSSGDYGYLVIYLGDPPLKIFPDKEE